MGLLDKILAAKFKLEPVHVPEWDDTYYVREMSAGERDHFEATQTESKGIEKYKNFRARVVCLTLCDADGKRLFRDDQVSDLAKLPAAGVVRVFDAACKINGLLEENVKELEKN